MELADMRPIEPKVAIEIELPSERRQKEYTKIKGFQFAESEFEGVPNTGFVGALYAGYKGPLKVGGRVVVEQGSLGKGFKLSGKIVHFVSEDKIIGTFND